MRCPFCGHEDSQVKDSRQAEDGTTIRRRRQCPECVARFTTFERVQIRELVVVKSSNKQQLFDRDKLVRSIQLACSKRPIGLEKIEKIVNGIVRQLESSGDTEFPSKAIGERVMNALKDVDTVAYVRYASVYKDFREVEDFNEFLDDMRGVPVEKGT